MALLVEGVCSYTEAMGDKWGVNVGSGAQSADHLVNTAGHQTETEHCL